jgi:methionine sulfoxide reductase heme-binding subunit
MMDEMTIRVVIRTTARISFVLFLGAFLGNALYGLVPAPATRWLKANKDGLTLGFAGSHTVHLAFILALVAADESML